MVVVMILGILLAVAVPQWMGARERTRERACLNNLKEIGNAKDRWAMENRAAGTDIPSAAQLAPEFLKGSMPICPSGGTYTIGNVDAEPSCSVHGTPSTLNP